MHDSIDFVSTVVSVLTENEVDIVAFGDADLSPETWIIISRYDDPGAPDAPRDEMVGIETSVSTHEIAAAIASIVLTRRSIEILIRQEKIESVGARRFMTKFDIADDRFKELDGYLEQVVSGSGIRLIRDLPNEAR
jgi:hypothetical protein